jgi:hypothetical protein
MRSSTTSPSTTSTLGLDRLIRVTGRILVAAAQRTLARTSAERSRSGDIPAHSPSRRSRSRASLHAQDLVIAVAPADKESQPNAP